MKLLDKILGKITKPLPVAWQDFYVGGQAPNLKYYEGSMYEAFYKASLKYPHNTAYNYFNFKCSYEKFNEQIITTMNALIELGVIQGDRVTICMPNTPEAVIMFYALNAMGATSNIIHPLSSEKEIEFYLNKSNSKYILCLDLLYDKVLSVINNTKIEKVIIAKVSDSMPIILKNLYSFKGTKKINYDDKTIKWSDFLKLGQQKLVTKYHQSKANDEAVILYSGGTTGDQKGVVLTNLNFNALGQQSFYMADPAKAGDKILVIMPLFHGFGIGVSVHTCLISGMTCILIPQFKASEFADLIKKYRPNFLTGVPTMYEALINSKKSSRHYLKSLTTVISGGDMLNETLQSKVNDYLYQHGSLAKVRVGYGLTECTGATCLAPRFYYKENAIGIPFPNTYYKIVKVNTFDKVKNGDLGEICISGPTVMKEYLEDKEETKKVLKRHNDGKIWLHTGDIGYIDSYGMVFFVSRLKRLIISSGYNIYPQHIEKVIMKHPAVLTAAVIGIPHSYRKQVVKAYIVLKDNFKENEELRQDIKNFCKKNIAKYSLPYEYEYLKEIPKTLVGKVAFTKLEKCDSYGSTS